MGKSIGLIPALGRDYKSRAEVKDDLEKGRDFIIKDISNPWDGKYCSFRDLNRKYDSITVRYGKLRKVAVFTIKDGIIE